MRTVTCEKHQRRLTWSVEIFFSYCDIPKKYVTYFKVSLQEKTKQ
jgi:hypothetical protein